jgi:chromosome segregation ATPase
LNHLRPKNTIPVRSQSISKTRIIFLSIDFDDTASIDEKQKHSSLPPPKEHSPRTPRRGSDSKLKAVYMGTNHNTRRKGNHLPSIRSKNRTKRLQKETTKNEIEQRLLSAQNDKLNKLQSRLTELRLRLEQERLENKTLRSIQKREEHVLQQYEDQEYNVHRLANDYTHDIEDVKGKIELERENKFELEKEIEDRSEILRDQTKRMKFYEKLIHEPNLDEPEKLREKLKETDKKLQKYQDKIANKVILYLPDLFFDLIF